MKKITGLLLSLLFVVFLAACGETTTTVEPTVPTLSGIESFVTLTAGDEFDPLEGVTATDEIDGDITDQIEVDGTDCLNLEDGVVTVGGIECTLTYTVTNSNDLSAMKISTVTIEKGEPVAGDNMIDNGDFETNELTGWEKGEFEGGAANVTAENGEMVIEMTAVSWGPASPRMHQGGLTYENGKTYQVSFDARADEARSMASQVGVLLDTAPWFTIYGDDYEVFELTTDMQTYTYTFTVSEADTTDGVVTFELGSIEGDETVTTVYIDNVVVQELIE